MRGRWYSTFGPGHDGRFASCRKCSMSRLERAADIARGAGKGPPAAGVPTAVGSVGTACFVASVDAHRAARRAMSSGGVARRPQKALTTYAHVNPAHCLVRGLFAKRKDGERPKIDLHAEYAGVHIHFVGANALGALDLRVLAAIVALAGRDGVEANTDTPVAQPLMVAAQNADMSPLPGDSVTRYIHVSRRALAREIGRVETGGAVDCIFGSIERMADITLHCRTQEWKWSSRLLSYICRRAGDEITIVINPRLAAAVACGGQYTHLDMSALRALSDVGVLLYHRLVSFVDRGTARTVGLRILVGYVWTDPATPNVIWKRRAKVRVAMRAIGALPGWSVQLREGDLFSIARVP